MKHFQKKIITRLLKLLQDKSFLLKSYSFKDYLLTFNKSIFFSCYIFTKETTKYFLIAQYNNN